MTVRALIVVALTAGWLSLIPVGRCQAFGQEAPVTVDASELDRRNDLVGKDILVDDRVRFYQSHQGKGYDELYLKRTGVIFRLPPRLRPETPPRPVPVMVRGKLGLEGGRLVCEVEALKTLPEDLDRLNQEIAALTAKDFEKRKTWAAWAEKRGKSFKPEDRTLIQRARAIQAEAMRIEAEQKRVAVDAPAEWLALAEEGRRKNIPEPDPSALAHKAFQARLAAMDKSEALKEVISAIERFFPEAAKDQESGKIPLGQWERAYADDPATTYRTVPANLRKALNRRLWADAIQRLLETQASEEPAMAAGLAQRAESELPERPRLASALLTQGLAASQRNVGTLRLSEVKSMGQAYRLKLDNPGAELELYRRWLKVQRDRLSDTDAEGPIALAGLYDELLHDRTTARELLQRAWKIDPTSKEVAEAFLTRGYRRVKDDWVEGTPSAPARDGSSEGVLAPRSETIPSQSLRGKTPEEVIQKIGLKPDRKTYSGSKGQLIEQWIFVVDARQVRYVNFLRSPDELFPRVVSDYFLPRALVKGDLKANR
jgi:hypothetical protein